jgi:hypothetical protein
MLSEAYGFIISLRYTTTSQELTILFYKAEVDAMLTKMVVQMDFGILTALDQN